MRCSTRGWQLLDERFDDLGVSGARSAGRVPLGYKAELATRQLVIHDEEAAVVRAFFEQCASGESAASIVTWANDAGHRTKVVRAATTGAVARSSRFCAT